MTNSQSATSSPHVVWLLSWADELVRARKWNEADAVFKRAVSVDASCRSHIAFGCALAEQERFHEALCEMTSALDIAQAAADVDAISIIHHNFAVIYREVGDFDLARRFQQRALAQTDDCGSFELLALANDAWLAERHELAECLAGTAADIDDEEAGSNCPEIEATCAVISGFLHDPRKGIEPLLRAYARHKAAGEFRLMGIDLLNLSNLLGELGRYRGELACVRRAIACFNAAPAPISAAKARRILEHLERLRAVRQFDPSRN